MDGLIVDSTSPFTNMVYLNLSKEVKSDAHQVTEKLKDHGVLVDPESPRRFRLVTHYWIDDQAVERTVTAFQKALD